MLLFNPFQPSVVFHIETVIRFALQTMPDFYMESYTGLKWVKIDCSLPQCFKYSLPNCFWGSFVNRTQNSSKNPKPYWRLRFGGGLAIPRHSNSEGLRDIQYSMSMVLDKGFYYETRQILLQNATAMLLQNATKVYYKMRQVFYYKIRQLLQNATLYSQILTNCEIIKVTHIENITANAFSHLQPLAKCLPKSKNLSKIGQDL